MTEATELLPAESPEDADFVERVSTVRSYLPPAGARRLPPALLTLGLLLLGGGLVLSFLPTEPVLAERLTRAGIGPSTLLLFGAGLVGLALVVRDFRRTEQRLAEAVEAAAASDLPRTPPEILERLDALARTVESLRPSQEVVERLDTLGRGVETLRSSLAQVDIVARKVTDGVEATYRSTESLKERLGRLRTEAGSVGPEDLDKTRASLEEGLRAVRAGMEGLAENLGKGEDLPRLRAEIEGLRRAAAEERDVSRAIAAEMERLVTLVADRMTAIAESIAAIARSAGETRELRSGIERIQAALRELPAPAPPPPPPQPNFGREPIPSWEGRRGETFYPPPAPPPPDPGRAFPPAAPGSGPPAQGILDAIQRLKSLRKPPEE